MLLTPTAWPTAAAADRKDRDGLDTLEDPVGPSGARVHVSNRMVPGAYTAVQAAAKRSGVSMNRFAAWSIARCRDGLIPQRLAAGDPRDVPISDEVHRRRLIEQADPRGTNRGLDTIAGNKLGDRRIHMLACSVRAWSDDAPPPHELHMVLQTVAVQ